VHDRGYATNHSTFFHVRPVLQPHFSHHFAAWKLSAEDEISHVKVLSRGRLVNTLSMKMEHALFSREFRLVPSQFADIKLKDDTRPPLYFYEVWEDVTVCLADIATIFHVAHNKVKGYHTDAK
jgi:hypothetical protein